LGASADAAVEPATVTYNTDSYADRLEILKLLRDFSRLPDWASDPMDGDCIQTEWQEKTGRDGLKWWSRINYCLVIWRLQALQSAGKFKHIELTGTMQAPLPDLVCSELLRYYRAVHSFSERDGGSAGMLQKLFWLVHARTVEAALRSANELDNTLPDGERNFALGWGAVMVKVLAETNFSTGGATISQINMAMLPQRILCPADLNLTDPCDLPEAQRQTAGIISALYGRRSLLSLFLPILAFGAPLVELLILADQRFREVLAVFAKRRKQQ